MDWINIIFTSISMSFDAMTVGAVDGVNEKNMAIRKMLLIAFVFGFMQFLMPVIGYFIGFSFKDYLELYIPWIAFGLLGMLSIESLVDWLIEFKKSNEEEFTKEKKLTYKTLLIQGVATSIDALCIGFVFLNYNIPSAMITFMIIGITTFILTTISISLANKVAGKLEKWGGLIAAIVFIAIALKILLQGIL